MSEKLTCVFCGMPIEWGIGHRSFMECIHYVANTVVPSDQMPLFFRDHIGHRQAMIDQFELHKKTMRDLMDAIDAGEPRAVARSEEIRETLLSGPNRFYYSGHMLGDAPYIRAMQQGRAIYAN